MLTVENTWFARSSNSANKKGERIRIYLSTVGFLFWADTIDALKLKCSLARWEKWHCYRKGFGGAAHEGSTKANGTEIIELSSIIYKLTPDLWPGKH